MEDWKALIASAPQLPPGEALATTDSLWASFRAGKVPARWLIDEARAMSANPSAAASVDPGERLSGLYKIGLIGPDSAASYHALIGSIYGPRLASIGFDPTFGSQVNDPSELQKLRQQLVALMALDAHDPQVRAKLKSAADAYLGGDDKALDPSFYGSAFSVVAEEGGLTASGQEPRQARQAHPSLAMPV